jgi:predicted SnoaL-like aldol condensation-catalyzing enzyme
MFVYTDIHAVLGEGNFVLTVSEGQWNGGTHAFYDLFRMEGGMIVEHWDVIQPVPTEGLANTTACSPASTALAPTRSGIVLITT